MAKKFGKFMLISSIAAAAGAGVYYYLKGKKDNTPEDNFDSDELDDFDDDLDDDIDDNVKSHPHVSVSIDLDGAKERIGEKVIETLDKAKEFIGEVTSANSEPVYTKVDLPPREEAPADEASSADASDSSAETETEEFFNDAES